MSALWNNKQFKEGVLVGKCVAHSNKLDDEGCLTTYEAYKFIHNYSLLIELTDELMDICLHQFYIRRTAYYNGKKCWFANYVNIEADDECDIIFFDMIQNDWTLKTIKTSLLTYECDTDNEESDNE